MRDLETVHQKTFGRALKLRAVNEPLNKVNERSTNQPRKCVEQMDDQYSFFSTTETGLAVNSIIDTPNNVVSFPEKLGGAPRLAASKEFSRTSARKKI